jgi:hypothetical protein
MSNLRPPAAGFIAAGLADPSLATRHRAGSDTIQVANKWLSHLPQETQDKLTVGNAARVYNFTPADPASLPA